MDKELKIKHEAKIVRQLLRLPTTKDIQFVDSGWTSRVYVVDNGRYVVKFPRRQVVRAEYAREALALQTIQQIQSEVSVPRLIEAHPQYDYIAY